MTPKNTDLLKSILFDRIPKPRKFEDRLWSAADNLRANARLKSSEYAAPLLGLFFLRYASNRFNEITEQAKREFEEGEGSRNSETIEEVYKRLCGFYLPIEARYESLLDLTDKDNVQQAVIDAMEAFEKENENAGVKLPINDYLKIPHETLREILNVLSEIKVAEGDVFGKIYEYFLGKFALSEGQKGGEFYTPTSVVKLIVEVIEPFKPDARVFDPACGTGGMFVQSAKFVERHMGMQRLSIYGQEKVDETANLGKLNLFVNGLKGDIRNINSSLTAAAYTEEYADTFGKFDFVMANPPFNVDSVKIEDIGNHPLFATYGLPVSMAKSGKKSDTFSNANYLWISLFANALNETGRAGFVMANSSSDARGGELEVRRKMVEAGLVDVMITIASNFFYTVTLPVTLWFFDRAKTNVEHPRHDQTLFIDARRIFNQVTRANREFTQAQLLNIASIVWLYRGETEKFQELRELYDQAHDTWRDGEVNNEDTGKTYKGVAAHREQLAVAFRALGVKLGEWRKMIAPQLTDEAKGALADNANWESNLVSLAAAASEQLMDKVAINDLFKRAEEAVTFADKILRPPKDKTFTKADIRGALKRLVDEREDALFVLERIGYFEAQAAWLNTNFPDGVWRDVEGLCKIASRAEIAQQGFSLNPGRFVGVSAEGDEMTNEEFRVFLETNTRALTRLHTEADELQRLIFDDLQMLFTEVKAEAV
ncbi:MAG TPA: class I SAM-dependent DNA methyltransferase [Pyrinomonadaceae bacterium]|nr:class I SAM-dependent DNA methyltransferase [Pyrinomonadaceae bacterium]